MTTPEPPDDELVSAVLDGEATDDERATVEGSAELLARLAEFRALRQGFGAATEDDHATGRDDRVAAALAAADPRSAGFDDEGVTTGGPELHGSTAPVPAARHRRAPLAWVAGAAALLAVLAVAFVGFRGHDDPTDRASDTGASTTAPPAAEAAAPPASGADGDLGSFGSVAELRAALGTGDVARSAPASDTAAAGAVPSSPPGVDRAPDVDCTAAISRAGATPVGTASVAGTPVAVGRLAQGGIVVLAGPTCTPR